MKFIHNDLGQRKRGETVEVTLTGNAANVRLMDNTNFAAYKRGQKHTYQGGLAKRSPVKLQIPRNGHWHIAVDMQGLQGTTNAAVRILPGALPEIQDPALSSVPGLVHNEPAPGVPSGKKQHDVFISHASDDKDSIVRDLANALINEGLDVWYDDFTLRIGDSLRQKIDQGLATSRVGLVVFSEAFFGKGWANYELDGIVSRSVSGEQILLPIWHGVTKKQVMDYSPSLADKVARSTASCTVEEIAAEIANLIQESRT